MSQFDLGATADTTDRTELDYDYTLSDNVVRDLVKYTRSKTVKNEQQFVLTTLCYLSGFMENPKHYNSFVLIGTAGSGKSHLKNTVEDLFPDEYLYYATSGSDKSIIYDDSWEDAYFASLDELQKPSEDVIEILKSLHGGEDEEFRYQVTGGGKGADREVDEIVRSAIPYGFLYAQYEPDFEMWDRLLKIPVHESTEKNDGVARTQWDHAMISFADRDTEYMYDFQDGEKAIRDHIRNLPKNATVKIPAGEEVFGWDAYKYAKNIFDIERSETNRVSGMVANLVRASALLNHENREKRSLKLANEGRKNGVIIASKQDVANVLACREVLLATTHQLDQKRRAICLAIQETSDARNASPIKHPNDDNGKPQSIMGYLRRTNASFVKRSQIEAMLEDLQDNGLVEKMEKAGDNGRHLFQFQSWQGLGKFDIDSDFKATFEGSEDPFEDTDFITTARRLNEELTPNASELMRETEVTSDSGEAQATLEGGSTDSVDVDLEPHEELVHSMLKETVDGKVIDNLDEHDPTPRELIGLVPMGEPDDSVDPEGTILDPDHEVWQYGPEDWVTSTQDAEQEIENALRTLTVEGVMKTSVKAQRGDQPITMEVSVADV